MSSGFVSAGKTQDFGSANDNDSYEAAPPDDSGTSQTRDPWVAAEEAINRNKLDLTSTGAGGSGGGGGGGAAAAAAVDDGRSLFEVLQANKARKQEEFEEKLKFKNQFRALDEDEIDFLDSIVSSERAAEAARKKEVESKLDDFRKLQYDADHDSTALTGERPTDATENWAVGNRKRRKKDKEKDAGGMGLKLRKMSDGSKRESEPEAKAKPLAPTSTARPRSKEEEAVKEIDAKSQDGGDKTSAKSPAIATSKPASATNESTNIMEAKKPTGGLGLVGYGSDSDSD